MSYGEPSDRDGQCNARLYIGDDFGDNHATMRCQLAPGHDGKHRERFERSVDGQRGEVTVEWDHDEAEDKHGNQG